MRQNAADEAAAAESPAAATNGEAARLSAAGRCSQTWAMLIKRVYEIDPLARIIQNCGNS